MEKILEKILEILFCVMGAVGFVFSTLGLLFVVFYQFPMGIGVMVFILICLISSPLAFFIYKTTFGKE